MNFFWKNDEKMLDFSKRLWIERLQTADWEWKIMKSYMILDFGWNWKLRMKKCEWNMKLDENERHGQNP